MAKKFEGGDFLTRTVHITSLICQPVNARCCTSMCRFLSHSFASRSRMSIGGLRHWYISHSSRRWLARTSVSVKRWLSLMVCWLFCVCSCAHIHTHGTSSVVNVLTTNVKSITVTERMLNKHLFQISGKSKLYFWVITTSVAKELLVTPTNKLAWWKYLLVFTHFTHFYSTKFVRATNK